MTYKPTWKVTYKFSTHRQIPNSPANPKLTGKSQTHRQIPNSPANPNSLANLKLTGKSEFEKTFIGFQLQIRCNSPANSIPANQKLTSKSQTHWQITNSLANPNSLANLKLTGKSEFEKTFIGFQLQIRCNSPANSIPANQKLTSKPKLTGKSQTHWQIQIHWQISN